MLFKADIVHDYICISNELERGVVLPDLTMILRWSALLICFAEKKPVYSPTQFNQTGYFIVLIVPNTVLFQNLHLFGSHG